ncbi:DUF397 domain-containing protein [Streptomyces sp. NPDC050085]|uniref:DUF397 domain-containing protein n=1 Tax=Streptomyces sp. NPDC050085 TaxID=3365600 RepID=UPI0037968C95
MNHDKAELYALDLTDADWTKSSFSAGENDCVEITVLPGGGRAVRDSKHPEREALRYTATEWAAFRQAMIAGEL